MCRVFTFHHFCGHVHLTRNLPCPNPVPYTSSQPSCHSRSNSDPDQKILSPSPACADSTSELHLYPTLCDTCTRFGIVSDWFANQHGARFQVIMDWRNMGVRDGLEAKRLSISDTTAAAAATPISRLADTDGEFEDIPLTPPPHAYQQSSSDAEGSGSESGSDSSIIIITATTAIRAGTPTIVSNSPPRTVSGRTNPSLLISAPPESVSRDHSLAYRQTKSPIFSTHPASELNGGKDPNEGEASVACQTTHALSHMTPLTRKIESRLPVPNSLQSRPSAPMIQAAPTPSSVPRTSQLPIPASAAGQMEKVRIVKARARASAHRGLKRRVSVLGQCGVVSE
jgi:hypothetical protein